MERRRIILPAGRRLGLITAREAPGVGIYTGIIPVFSDTIVSHVVISGGIFNELISTTSWTANGTVPFNAAENIGFAGGAKAESIGPFSALNNYSIPSGFMASTFDFQNDHNWIATIITKRATVLSGRAPWGANDGSTRGPILLSVAGNRFQQDYGGSLSVNGAVINANVPAVVSVGYYVGTDVFRVRVLSTLSGGSVGGFDITHAQCTPIVLGRDANAFQPWDGKIFEFCVRIPAAVVSVADLDAQLLAINNAVIAAG